MDGRKAFSIKKARRKVYLFRQASGNVFSYRVIITFFVVMPSEEIT